MTRSAQMTAFPLELVTDKYKQALESVIQTSSDTSSSTDALVTKASVQEALKQLPTYTEGDIRSQALQKAASFFRIQDAQVQENDIGDFFTFQFDALELSKLSPRSQEFAKLLRNMQKSDDSEQGMHPAIQTSKLQTHDLTNVQSAYLSMFPKAPPANNSHNVKNDTPNFPLPVSNELPTPFPPKIEDSGDFVVWQKENRISSDDSTVAVAFHDQAIRATAEGIKSKHIHISGSTILNELTGHEPFAETTSVTQDGFDQIQATWAADYLLLKLARLGLDIESFLTDVPNGGKLRVRVNADDMQNAYYSPRDNEIVTGTSDNTWHLAADQDILMHEQGHYLLDHINPEMPSDSLSVGGAIHEGFADALAAFTFNDSEISEDFAVFADQNKTEYKVLPDCLRNVNNELTKDDVSSESHDYGQVFGGFLWSIKNKLAKLIDNEAIARETMVGIMVQHAIFYTSTGVSEATFIEAMTAGAKAYLQDKLPEDKVQNFVQQIKTEGIARKLISDDWEMPESGVPAEVKNHESDFWKNGPPSGHRDVAQLALHLSQKLCNKNNDNTINFEAINHQRMGEYEKIITKASYTQPDGKTIPIEDAHLALIINNGSVERVAGSAQKLPSDINLQIEPQSITSILAQAKRHTKRLISSKADVYKKLCEYIHNNIDKLFAPENVNIEQIIHHGTLCNMVHTKVGSIIVDPKSDYVRVKHLCLIDT